MKKQGNLIIEKDCKEDFSQLTEICGSVDVREGATFTAPVLVNIFVAIGYNLMNGVFGSGIYMFINEKEREYLLRLKPIVNSRLNMKHWHQDDSWKECSVDQNLHECGTTHCLAGWIQIFEKDKYNEMEAEEVGRMLAPNLAKLFYKDDEIVKRLVNSLA